MLKKGFRDCALPNQADSEWALYLDSVADTAVNPIPIDGRELPREKLKPTSIADHSTVCYGTVKCTYIYIYFFLTAYS